MKLADKLAARSFAFVHQHNLVYNTCWEDPRLDRAALALGPHDRIAMITSAGCNALDYALDAPRHIDAIDLNFRQNALLELKMAGIRRLDHATFFAMFGRGRAENPAEVYRDALRDELAPRSQAWWDRHIGLFAGRGWRRSFYFRGTSGLFARAMNTYLDRVVKMRDVVEALLAASDLRTQRELYARSRDRLWRGLLRWLLSRDTTLAMLGVPRAQRQHLERQCGGIAGFVERCLDTVFGRLSLTDNYFWRVYLTGEYAAACCPEYLRPANFARLKAGLVDRIATHTMSLGDFFARAETPVTRFVLLDHMDWLASAAAPALRAEWQSLIAAAAPRARIIWRSGGTATPFVDELPVMIEGSEYRVGELLRYDRPLAEALHPRDRVHTYASFHIAELNLGHRAADGPRAWFD